MKIKIDKDGRLFLDRAGKMTKQWCPYSQSDNSCGDWCPHFGEPEPHEVADNPGMWPTYYHQDGEQIRLCHGTVIVGEIEDEREKP